SARRTAPRSGLTSAIRARSDRGVTRPQLSSGVVQGRLFVRSVGLLLGLCLLAGVVVAGVTYPLALGAGLAANQASDSLSGVSAELIAGALPQTTTITDSKGNPIAHLF